MHNGVDNSGNYSLDIQVWRHALASIADAMGIALERAAYSPNIKERLDHSCGLFDAQGRLIEQAAHIPVHLGAMPIMMRKLFTHCTWQPGDIWLCNHPEFGGTHLPDLTMVAPVFTENQEVGGATLVGFVAARAHHADIGGMAPGSLPHSRELVQEGLILPPIRIARRGRVQQEVLELICANSRTPRERRGDLQAQIGAVRFGAERLQHLAGEWGLDALNVRAAALAAYTRRIVRETLDQAPTGDYTFEDSLEGSRGSIPIRLKVTIAAGRASFDFTRTALQQDCSLNCPLAVTWSACAYVIRCLCAHDLPMNYGLFEPLTIVAPAGTLINCDSHCAVSAGNVETSQRTVDVLLGALALAYPVRVPAASQGTMNNLMVGGWDATRNAPFVYYETIAGGAGAGPLHSGATGVQVHMTNTRNTPTEVLEMHYPIRVLKHSMRASSGGIGLHNGGDGVVRTLELQTPATVTVISQRRTNAPYGLKEGDPGLAGVDTIRTADGLSEPAGRESLDCGAGDCIEIETPGGGGWGVP